MQIFALKQATNAQQQAAAALVETLSQRPALPHLGSRVDATA